VDISDWCWVGNPDSSASIASCPTSGKSGIQSYHQGIFFFIRRCIQVLIEEVNGIVANGDVVAAAQNKHWTLFNGVDIKKTLCRNSLEIDAISNSDTISPQMNQHGINCGSSAAEQWARHREKKIKGDSLV
jgi:hypothetical protein